MTLNEIIETLDIDSETKQLYRNFCAVIETNVEENLTKTPFELATETGISYDKWVKFFEKTEINAWVNDTIRVIAKATQRKRLQGLGKDNATTNDVNAYKVLSDYNENAKQSDNSNVVLIRIPETDEIN
jgi:phage FluMu gp28-like protein